MKEETRKKRKLEETPRLQTLRAEMKRWAQFEAAETTRWGAKPAENATNGIGLFLLPIPTNIPEIQK